MDKIHYTLGKLSLLLLCMTFVGSTFAASISGKVWDDVNGDGIRQGTEQGIANIWVNLEDPNGGLLQSVQTSGNGDYAFNGIAAGTYVIKFANPGGMMFMSPINQGNDPTIDSDGDPFGYTAPISLANANSTAANIDGGFNMLGACFTPITAIVNLVTCDYNNTMTPTDDLADIVVTFSGGTGPWGWDYAPGNVMMYPYDSDYTFNDIPVNANGIAEVTINDHDNPFCTYTVQVQCPPPSGTLTFNCANNLSYYVDPGTMGLDASNIPLPTASSTCPIGTVSVVQISGPTGTLPVGMSTICYEATDGCGNVESCCINIEVKKPCDTKDNDDIIFELLDTDLDANGDPTYKFRITNNRSRELKWVAFQMPSSIIAKAPAQGSMYTAPSGNQYSVRNPNYTPFYSIRFASKSTGISNGESDIFCFTLPRKVNPKYFLTRVRIDPKVFIDAHMNTFKCDPFENVRRSGEIVSQSQSNERGEITDELSRDFTLYPNPTSDRVWVDLEGFEETDAIWLRMLDMTGRTIVERQFMGGTIHEVTQVQSIRSGIYLIQITDAEGRVWTQKLMVE